MEEGKNRMGDRTKRGRSRSRDFSLKPYVWKSEAANEKRRKKRKETTTTNDKYCSLKPHGRTTNKNDFHDDLVATQILSRLPAKSLMRFKSACKGWKLIIERDSHFIKLHRIRSQARPPRLLTIIRNCFQGDSKRTASFDLFSADLDCVDGGDVRGATVQSITRVVMSNGPPVSVLGLVRGLLCLVDRHNSEVMVYNVSTGQAVTPWITSTVWSSRKCSLRKPICQFGFDSNTGKHKVIFVWHDSRVAACEVLTVGVDTSWRIIDAVPPKCEYSAIKRTYANGSMYYMLRNKGFEDVWTLVAFDIGPEKFRMMRIPKFCNSSITELDGCLTGVLNRPQTALTQKLMKFHDRNKERTTSSTAVVSTSEEEDWSEVSIEMPWYITPETLVLYHSIPGKDQIILETYNGSGEPACFYCYNRINKTFNKFEIQGIPLLPGWRSYYKLFVEDLFHAADYSAQ